MKPGETAHITVDHIDLEGESVSLLANLQVACPGLFPGEQAQVRVQALSRHHPRAFARLEQLEVAHPARRAAPCPNHVGRAGACTGCALMELSEPAQREAKRQMLARQFGLTVREVEPSPAALGYRLSSKRVALSRDRQLTLGSFARGTHIPAGMTGCLVDHPRLVAAFDALERAARALGVVPYDERTRQGDLRYVWGKSDGERVILTLVVARADSRARALLPAALPELAGLLLSVQSADGNALRGTPAELLCGQPQLSIALLDQQVEVGALGFLQPNPSVAEAAYRVLVQPPAHPAGRALAFDLYAGAGLTTHALRAHYREVVPCESYPESAARLNIAPLSVEAFLERELSRAARRTPDLVVANPPRKGLGSAVTKALNQLASPVLRIMSCGPEGLARDLTALTRQGSYQLCQLRAFDTLPQTPHVELVAELQLRSSPSP